MLTDIDVTALPRNSAYRSPRRRRDDTSVVDGPQSWFQNSRRDWPLDASLEETIRAATAARLKAAADARAHVPFSELLWLAAHVWSDHMRPRLDAVTTAELRDHTALMRMAHEAQAAEALARGEDVLAKARPSIFAQMAQRYADLGYSPIARFRLPEGDSWPKAWSDYCDAPASPDLIREWGRKENAQIAVCTGFGNLLVPEADTDDQEILAAILAVLPQCRFARFGSKGFALLARYEGEEKRIPSIYTGSNSEKRPLVEFKWRGHNITLPPSIHRSTGSPYYWFDPHTGKRFVECPAVDELPVITEADLDRLRTALAPWATPPRPERERSNGFYPTKVAKSRYEAWYRAGLTKAQSRLSDAREGRPTMLFRSVCALGAGVHHGFIPKFEFEGAFLDACDVNGLTGREGRHAILATIESGLRWAENDEVPDLGEPKSRAKRSKPNGTGNGKDDGEHSTSSANGSQERPQGKRPDIDLLRDKNEKVIKDQRNFRRIAEHEMWRFRFNERTGKQELTGLPGYPDLDDAAYAKIRQHCASQYACKFTKDDLHEIISVVSRENRYHPVLDYFNGLEWDGVERKPHVYFGAKEDNKTAALIWRKTLIAAVRRARRPGCQSKYLMVLEGRQDQGKSKGLQALCPDSDWFTDNFSLERDTDPKKVIEQTRGKVIVEISELDMRRGDAERIKGMLSRNVDEGRPSYGRSVITVPRGFIFIGTCNELLLIDTTGNVRFWPIECSEEIDVEAIERDRDQLWAEHAYYEAKREAIHLTKGEDDKAAAKDIADARLQRETGDEIQNAIAAWAITDYKGGGTPLRKIAKEALGIETENLDRGREMRIGSALRKAGFERHKSMGLITWKRK